MQAIYWVGPFIGGVAAAFVYSVVQFINKRAEEMRNREQMTTRHIVLHELHVPDVSVSTF